MLWTRSHLILTKRVTNEGPCLVGVLYDKSRFHSCLSGPRRRIYIVTTSLVLHYQCLRTRFDWYTDFRPNMDIVWYSRTTLSQSTPRSRRERVPFVFLLLVNSVDVLYQWVPLHRGHDNFLLVPLSETKSTAQILEPVQGVDEFWG